MSKSRLYLLSLFRKKLVTFCTIWAIFGRKLQVHKSKVQNQNLIYPFTPARFLVNLLQKKLIRPFSSFVATGHKGHYRKFSPGFKSLASFLGTTPTYLNENLDFLMRDLMVHRLAPISNP